MSNEKSNTTISANSSVDDDLIDMFGYYGCLPNNLEQAMLENSVSWHNFMRRFKTLYFQNSLDFPYWRILNFELFCKANF